MIRIYAVLIVFVLMLSGTVVVSAQSGGGYDLSWSTVDGGGHTIPSVASYIGPTLEGFLGKQNRDFEMADGAWSFLRYQHRTGTDAACGNWCIEPGEECDDGNQTDGDGCSAACVAVFPALPTLSFGGLAALVLGFFGLGVVALRRSTAG